MSIRRRHFLLLVCGLALLTCSAWASSSTSVSSVILGHAAAVLNGPWRFHTGDDPLWAQPEFDDSAWETVDLTAPNGARDSDVGLMGYVAGWQAKGHPGYFGYAWYRIHLAIDAPPGAALALCGPFYVDSAYQVFFNGKLLGSSGKFSRHTPTAYNPHLPRVFPLPGSFDSGAGSAVLAVRVWMGLWAIGAPDTGGIHIAPAMGTTEGIGSIYRRQWIQMILGYVVDAVEALIFILLAVMACALIRFDRANPAYPWFAAALVMLAAVRGNQAIFFWSQIESVQVFELSTVIFIPLSLATWTLAWRSWFGLRQKHWPSVVAALTLLYMVSQFLRRSWFYGVFPRWFGRAMYYCSSWARLCFVVLTLLIAFHGLRHPGREKWLAVPALVLLSIGLFAQELSMLHVPGIWFPFGIGVSRTQFAYAAFDVVLFGLLLQRVRDIWGRDVGKARVAHHAVETSVAHKLLGTSQIEVPL